MASIAAITRAVSASASSEGKCSNAAADEAIEESIASGKESEIGMAHLREAMEQIRPTTLEWLTSARNHARYANQGGQYDDVLKFLEKQG